MSHLSLSIVGGGIRGIIPCLCLVELEKQTGKLTRDIFSYVAGTSTGALLAAAIAAGIPASELLKVYTDRSKEIFTPGGIIARSKRFAVGYMYEPTKLRDVLSSVFKMRADWTVNDSPIGICISATAMNGRNWFFVKDHPFNARTTGKVKLLDAAVASACAPTYHDHWKIDGIQGKTVRFFDGGVGGVANPCYQACLEMFQYDNFLPAETKMVTLGTGFYPSPDQVPNGLLQLIGWTTSTLVDSSQDWMDDATKLQWPGVMTKFNWQLPKAIDESDLSAIPLLVELGNAAAKSMDWAKLLSS